MATTDETEPLPPQPPEDGPPENPTTFDPPGPVVEPDYEGTVFGPGETDPTQQ